MESTGAFGAGQVCEKNEDRKEAASDGGTAGMQLRKGQVRAICNVLSCRAVLCSMEAGRLMEPAGAFGGGRCGGV